MTIFYLDYVNGADANDGSSWALAWKTITSGATAARIAPGDIIRIAKSPDPTSLGMTATWTNLSRAVVLNSALTANVDLCNTAWTASANVTATTNPTRKEGSSSSSLAILAAFTTGKVAYKALAGATDYSGYQQLSFWIQTTVAIATNTLKLSLCSDAIGNVIVDDFIIPAVPGIARWTCFTVDKGAALGASIQSVALYALLDPGTPTIFLDNIIACKASTSADSLSLTSLISKNSLAQGGTECWFSIRSINDTAIQLDAGTPSVSGAGRGYSGTTETVTTYKRETIKTVLAPSIGTVIQNIMDSGTVGNNIQYQGGYNTATTIQDGETFFDGSNGNGYGLQLSVKTYNTLNYLNFSRYNYGIYFTSSSLNTITTVTNVNNNTSYGIYFSSSSLNTITTITNANNNSIYGIYFSNSNNNMIRSLSTSGNTTGGIFNDTGINYVNNAVIAEATKVAGFTAFANSRIFLSKYNNDPNDNRIYTDDGTIVSQIVTRHTASGIAWQLSPTSANRQASYPLDLCIAKIAVSANNLVTVSAWFRRSDTGLTMQLVCKGGQINGVPNDVIASMTAIADTWEELTITFTPTEVGVVEIMAYAYGGTTYSGYIDDMTITQA